MRWWEKIQLLIYGFLTANTVNVSGMWYWRKVRLGVDGFVRSVDRGNDCNMKRGLEWISQAAYLTLLIWGCKHGVVVWKRVGLKWICVRSINQNHSGDIESLLDGKTAGLIAATMSVFLKANCRDSNSSLFFFFPHVFTLVATFLTGLFYIILYLWDLFCGLGVMLRAPAHWGQIFIFLVLLS